MFILFLLLSIVAIVLMILGFISPKRFIFWGERKRVHAFFYFLAFVIFFGAALATSPDTAASQPKNKYETIINKDLGAKTNKGKKSFIKYEEKGKQLIIYLNASQSLSAKDTKESILYNTAKIMPDIFKKTSKEQIEIDWYLPLVDLKGNESNERVMRIGFTKDNAKTINWDNVLAENMPKIADLYWQHPALNK